MLGDIDALERQDLVARLSVDLRLAIVDAMNAMAIDHREELRQFYPTIAAGVYDVLTVAVVNLLWNTVGTHAAHGLALADTLHRALCPATLEALRMGVLEVRA
jgi:hypothetical protein